MFIRSCLLCFALISLSYCGNIKNKYIILGGYNSLFCFNATNSSINIPGDSSDKPILCTKSTEKCDSGNSYKCKLNCGSNIRDIRVNGKYIKVSSTPRPEFKLPKAKYFRNNMNITFAAQNGSAVYSISREDVHINFSYNNIFCKQFWIGDHSIICSLATSKGYLFYQTLNISISIQYGNSSCNPPQNLGHIFIGDFSFYFSVILIPTGIFVISLIIGGIVYVRIFKRKTASTLNKAYSSEIVQKEMKYIKLNKIAFLEYQTAIDSFSNLGRLHDHHILSFKDYISRTFNVELLKSAEERQNEELEDIKLKLLNKNILLKWIEDLNNSKRVKERSLIASLLTIVLFQHPKYFIRIMKDLLKQLVLKMRDKSEEKLLFRRSEALVENIIGNWITMCMYHSLKTGEIGKKFFNLYRAIKCKIESGIIDIYTKKSKFGLSFDQLLIGNLDYDVLTIQVDIEVQLQVLSSANSFIDIKLKNLSIEVLSLDSISQVKAKILDRAIMEYYEIEETSTRCISESSGVDLNKSEHLFLYLLSSFSKLLIDDYDLTNESTILDKEYQIVNTFKHYNIKSGSKFLLCTKLNNEITNFSRISSQSANKSYIHLHSFSETISPNFDLKLQSSYELNSKKPAIEIISEDSNKESCLMLILATKKSLSPFIDGFFQSIFNWKAQNHLPSSSNSLFESFSESQIFFNTEDNYLLFVYYLFSMLDDTAKQLGITDHETTQIWKSNSFILRFWVNMIKNPNFIFSIDRTDYIDNCLTTIASVLIESCSAGKSNICIDTPIIKQLFPQEVQHKYSLWWKCFANNSPFINEEDVISMMANIVEKSGIQNNFNSSLRSLLTISKGLNIQFPSEDMDLEDS